MDNFTSSEYPSQSSEHPSRPSEAAEVVRRKRKAQGQRACFPCRQRKVRCSYETPCQTCVSRDHPELCTYDAPLKRVHIHATADHVAEDPEFSRPTKSELDLIHTKLEMLEKFVLDIQQSISQLSAAVGQWTRDGNGPHGLPLNVTAGTGSREAAQPEGIYTNADMTGENVFLGPKSVPAMVMALGKGRGHVNIQEVLGSSVLPVFGLDNETATYPFVDLWGLPHGSPVRIQQLCAMLPSDADCLEYFRHYRDTAHILFPAVVDIEYFESDLTNFLILRDDNELGVTEDEAAKQEIYGKDLHWLGLLFATLASGCQCSVLPRKERQLTSQVYGKSCPPQDPDTCMEVVFTHECPLRTFLLNVSKSVESSFLRDLEFLD